MRRGEVFGLLGPNGAGKTTAIACLCGLLRPQSGELRFDGQPYRPRERACDRARFGYVPQELAVYDDLSARENLELFARLLGCRGRRSRGAVGPLAVGPRAARRRARREALGGMKRRLNIAASLLHEPELVLLDEPTVGVDPQSRHHIFESIESLATGGRSMLYTSHAMDEVERRCDRVAILDHGKLLAIGTPQELAAQAGTPGADLERSFLQLTGRNLRDDET